MEEPFLLIIAGPNGAGKTTLTNRLRREGIDLGEYINPDDIAKELGGSLAEHFLQAQKIADKRREDCISAKRSFAFETVMSHPSKVEVLVRAKEAGFFVQLFFVGTDDPKTNIDRVADRVAQGGHDVPTDKIVSRWDRTMGLVQEAIRAVDDALIFDNSLAGFVEGGPRLVFRRKILRSRNLPQSEQYPPIPNWVRHYILEPLGIESFESRDFQSLRSIVTAPFGSRAVPTTAPPEFGWPSIPHDLDLEQSVLGTLLTNNGIYDSNRFALEPGHFFEPIHQRIFEIVIGLIKSNKKANVATVQTFLPHGDIIAGLSVGKYLQILVSRADSNIDILQCGRRLSNLAFRRGLIAVGEDIANAARDASPESEPKALLAAVESRFDRLQAEARPETQPARFDQALVSAIDRAVRAYIRDGKTLGIATGLADLDRVTAGFDPSQLVVIASRSGMGKTALATSIAYNVAKSWKGEVSGDGIPRTLEGGVVGFFTLDLSAEQIATRVIAQQTGIAASVIQTGSITEENFEQIKDVAAEIQQLPLYIDDTGTITISQLLVRAKRLKQQRGLDLIIVDNLELLESATERAPRGEARNAARITSHLKALAKELSVPVILLSRLPPKIDNRRDRHPKFSDFKDSSLIERDADIVLFIYREEHYLLEERPMEGSYEYMDWITKTEAALGSAELIVARNKNGRTGTILLYFDSDTGRFDNLDHVSARGVD